MKRDDIKVLSLTDSNGKPEKRVEFAWEYPDDEHDYYCYLERGDRFWDVEVRGATYLIRYGKISQMHANSAYDVSVTENAAYLHAHNKAAHHIAEGYRKKAKGIWRKRVA